MLIQGIPGIKRPEELRDYIMTYGCYSPDENLQIYEKLFAIAPRYLFRAVNEKYNLVEKILCDVGCAYGMNLVFCIPGSYGIEIEEHEVKFANSLGLRVHQYDVMKEELSSLSKVEVVWCSAVLEHVDSPHILLRKLHLLLKPGGLLALYVPTIPLFPWLRHLPKLGKYFSWHTVSDHINAFVPATLRFFCEHAGFKTIEISPFYPRPLQIFNHVPIASRLIDGCIYIGQKIEDWEYPEKATRRVAVNGTGFVFKHQQFSYCE